ncbi:hypothetical protein LSAT2_019270 [Lamellibrachia satsuma]|nr:hypothetical protein LSAT2_019270 [Lamellibrachia satsuma]
MANVVDTGLYCDYDIVKGDGLYGDQTPTHRAMAEKAWPIIRNSLSSIRFTPGHGPFVICDYGTADGVNSLGLMTNCIDWVQKTYGEDQQVHIVYEDLPNNDFNALIRYIEGSDEQRQFKVQAARDWDNFLFYRSKELVPGGRLVTATVSDTSCSCAKTGTKVWCWMKKMTDLWREMMHEKIISEDEFFATVDPNFYRTAEEIHVPFNDKNSRTIRLLQGLTQYLLCNLHALGRIAFL